MIGAIWAQTREGIIGRAGGIPWKYPSDFARFKRVTMGAAVVMGRRTFDSIGRALPGRTNIVITNRNLTLTTPRPPGTDFAVLGGGDPALTAANAIRLARLMGKQDVWFIGGGEVYRAALHVCHALDVTTVPDSLDLKPDDVLAPKVDLGTWAVERVEEPILEADGLQVHRYKRRSG